jgi:hypothetical protein
MSNIDTGGLAFPATVEDGCNIGCPDMTLRDYFAARAMNAYCSDPGWRVDMTAKETAIAAYRMADAMLEARK